LVFIGHKRIQGEPSGLVIAHGSPRKLIDSSPSKQHAERARNRPCGAEFNRMPDALTTKSGARFCGYVASVAFVV
jgi:hypothetical protein